jgi:2-keto-4-pentenoate hydratase/2-oxohepta-3-ene-1,7-dioic acid hydratase in catechol pathway
VVKQHATTRDFLFDISRQIATLSASMTLLPGDVVSTGTPAGVGFTRNPPEFLCHGDLMETEVRGLGVLRNRIATSAALTTSGPHLDLDEAVAIQPVGAGGMR